MTRVSNLYRLQTIDSQMDLHLARVKEIETWFASRKEIEHAESELAKVEEECESSRRELLTAEENTRHQQQKITDTDKSLYSGTIRNPKELQDLQQEAGSLRRFLSTLEERQLQSMLASEEAGQKRQAAQIGLKEVLEKRSAQEEVLQKEMKELAAILEKISMQKEAALAAINEEDLAVYQNLRAHKRGIAVVKLDGDSCSGCGVAPSTSRVDSARSGQDVIFCGNCGRILYLG